VRLDDGGGEAGGFEIRGVFGDRARVGDAGDPGQQPFEIAGQRAGAWEVAESDAAGLSKDAGEFSGGCGLIGEGAEGAFADDSVECGVGEIEPFGISLLKGHKVRQACFLRLRGGTSDVVAAEVDTHNFATELARKEDRAFTLAACNIENALAGREGQQFAKALGQAETAGMERVAEQHADEIAFVDRGATGFEFGGRHGRCTRVGSPPNANVIGSTSYFVPARRAAWRFFSCATSCVRACSR